LDELGWDGNTPELSNEEAQWLGSPAVGEEVQW